MSRGLRGVLVAGAAMAAVFAVVTFYVNGWPGPTGPAVVIVVVALVLLAYLVAGVVAWQVHPRERIGLLFTVTGYALFLHRLSCVNSALPFTVSHLTRALYQACLVHLGLAWPYGYLRSGRDRVVVAVSYCADIGSSAVQLLSWYPRADGRGAACPANLLVRGSGWLQKDIGTASSVIGSCVAVVVALIAARWRSARGYARRSLTWLIWVALPLTGYVVVYDVHSGTGYPVMPGLLLSGSALLLITAPAAYAVSLARARSARAAATAAVVVLEPGPAPGRLRDALAMAIGDPTLQLCFRAGREGYVDTEDVPVKVRLLPAGRMLTPVGSGGGAVLVHNGELRHEPGLVRAAAAAANLALEHGRLQAAQLDQVRACRARIVEAGDMARRRLERDPHDGAQQRLVMLSLTRGMARSQAAGTGPGLESLLESASEQARQALAELRELARGIHPAVLTEAGLSAALQALAERSPVAATVTAAPARRFAALVEATAYFVVSEALANVAKHAAQAAARIGVWQQDRHLVVEVSDDGPGGARAEAGTGLADRVASVNGVLRIDSAPGRGTRLTAHIPCQ